MSPVHLTAQCLGTYGRTDPPTHAHSSCAERDEWHSCLSRAVPEDHEAQALAAFHYSAEVSSNHERWVP